MPTPFMSSSRSPKNAPSCAWRRRHDPQPAQVAQAGQRLYLFSGIGEFADLIHHPHFTLEVLLVREEQRWVDDGLGSWRRRHWSIQDRRLLAVGQAITSPPPLTSLRCCPRRFQGVSIVRNWRRTSSNPAPVAQKMAYCLPRNGRARARRQTRQHPALPAFGGLTAACCSAPRASVSGCRFNLLVALPLRFLHPPRPARVKAFPSCLRAFL